MAFQPKYTQINIRGQVFADCRAVAKHFGVNRTTVSRAVKAGKQHTIGIGKGKRETMPVEIRGKVYPSAQAAAKHFKVSDKAIYRAIDKGTTDKIGLKRNWPAEKRNERPVTLYGMAFKSQRAASLALGFEKEFIGRLIRGEARNPEAAWDTVLGRVMQLKAKDEQGHMRAITMAGAGEAA